MSCVHWLPSVLYFKMNKMQKNTIYAIVVLYKLQTVSGGRRRQGTEQVKFPP